MPISSSVRDVWRKKLKTEGHAKPLSVFNHIWVDLPNRLGSQILPLVFARVTPAKAGVTPASLSALLSMPSLQRNLTQSPTRLMDRHTLTSVRSLDKATAVFALFLESAPPGSQGTKVKTYWWFAVSVFSRTSLSSAHTSGRAQARGD